MPAEEIDSRTAILNAAVESFGVLGYYGTSLQRIATKVGLTKAGVLHHVGSKEGLLELVLNEMYDEAAERIISDMSIEQHPLISEMFRRIVAVNAQRPALVHMFSTLSAEALNPDHPAHAYFEERERTAAEYAGNIRWEVPDNVNIDQVLYTGWSAMDGVQLRWLRSPGQDLTALWSSCEDVLFPLPQWDRYR